MAAQAKHREAIVQAAALLFRRQGYAATGLNEIVAASGAPKGSVYYYFPDGKTQIGEAAVAFTGAAGLEGLRRLAVATNGPAALIRRYATVSADALEQSGWTLGCPIATILLETTPAETGITVAGAAALESWAQALAGTLAASGVDDARATALGRFAIAAVEGALLQARVQQSRAPLIAVGEELADLFDHAAKC